MWERDVCIGVWVQTLCCDTVIEWLCSWLCSSPIEASLKQQENWNSVFQHWAAYSELFYFCTCLINTELFSVVTQCGFVSCCWEPLCRFSLWLAKHSRKVLWLSVQCRLLPWVWQNLMFLKPLNSLKALFSYLQRQLWQVGRSWLLCQGEGDAFFCVACVCRGSREPPRAPHSQTYAVPTAPSSSQ